jgi:thiosulfate reductase cytochrome b subunit
MSTGFQPPRTLAGYAIWLVIVIAIVAAVYVAATAFGVHIPSWIITLFWICVAAMVVIAVIRFLASLGSGV